MLNIGAMRCVSGGGGVSPSSDKCSHLFCCVRVCVSACTVFVARFSCVFVCVCACVCAAEKDTAVAQ